MKTRSLALFMGVASCAVLASPAHAVTVTSANTTFTISNFGGPICELSTNSPIVLGVDNELFGLDFYHSGVTDASGTIGVNNLGAPNPAQVMTVFAGSSGAVAGFIDRANIQNPMFLTIWEGTPDPNNPNASVPGAILAQIPIPQSSLTAGPFPCLPLNAAPVASAGAGRSHVIPGSPVTLDGSTSSDPDNDTLTYSWTQISGPAVTLDNATSPTPSFTVPGGASTTPIVFQLIVNDGTVNSAPSTVTVTVQDNIGTAQAQIGNFLAQRNTILLANQPDIQRRIDRLTTKGSAAAAGDLAGAFSGMQNRTPIKLYASQGQVAAAGSLAKAAPEGKGGAGSWDIWAEGRFMDTRFQGRKGTANIIYAGIDKAVSDTVLLGVLGQYDRFDAKRSVTTGVLDGEGWMIGPYATARLADRLFLDARAAYGQTTNHIAPFGTYQDRFRTDRLLFAATLTGEVEPAQGLVIRPEVAAVWMDEKQKSYVDSLGSIIPGQSLDLGQLSFAPRIMYTANLDRTFSIRPFVEARGIYNFGNNAAALIGGDTRLRVEGGVDLLGSQGLRIGLSGFHDGIGMGGTSATGARLSIGFTF